MMTDLVERLREGEVVEVHKDGTKTVKTNNLMIEAADRIEELENDLQQFKGYATNLEVALDRLARLGNEPNHGNSIGNQIAIDALGQTPTIVNRDDGCGGCYQTPCVCEEVLKSIPDHMKKSSVCLPKEPQP